MPISLGCLEQVLSDALRDFFEFEGVTLANDVNERNSCGRLAIYLQRHADAAGLVGYFADTEYNRKQGGKVKTILDENLRIVTINCDLILHSRGNILGEDNLIAIEMKKATRSMEEKESDRMRLRAMTKSSYDDIWSFDGTAHPEHVCGYILGAFIEANNSKKSAKIEYFQKGHQIGAEVRSYFGRLH